MTVHDNMVTTYYTKLFRYTITSSLTFLLDLFLLFLLTDIFHLHYLISASCAFLLAVSVNYILSRKFVFPLSTQGIIRGYIVFIGIALSGLGIITAGMYLMVELLAFHYLIARITIALVAGLWNFTWNTLVNFRT